MYSPSTTFWRASVRVCVVEDPGMQTSRQHYRSVTELRDCSETLDCGVKEFNKKGWDSGDLGLTSQLKDKLFLRVAASRGQCKTSLHQLGETTDSYQIMA
ncbi:hypothetical protein ATANTOWER_024029 [Ataeniobius toweri]|uniref:Uncharacterized protein n=1 Tax=Ataeniobius toweri TaxID=208326 RepID=A0ABU7BBN0_9TELE|nr:hypothetical protein [Ataeniobius toweri]